MTEMDPVELLEREGQHGVRLTTSGQTWEVMFSAEGPLAGSIRRTGDGPRIAHELSRRSAAAGWHRRASIWCHDIAAS